MFMSRSLSTNPIYGNKYLITVFLIFFSWRTSSYKAGLFSRWHTQPMRPTRGQRPCASPSWRPSHRSACCCSWGLQAPCPGSGFTSSPPNPGQSSTAHHSLECRGTLWHGAKGELTAKAVHVEGELPANAVPGEFAAREVRGACGPAGATPTVRSSQPLRSWTAWMKSMWF